MKGSVQPNRAFAVQIRIRDVRPEWSKLRRIREGHAPTYWIRENTAKAPGVEAKQHVPNEKAEARKGQERRHPAEYIRHRCSSTSGLWR